MTITIDELTAHRILICITCLGILICFSFLSVLFYKNEAKIRKAKRYNEID
jgi:hypothetical protein